jgi:S-adenosyl-L-methionine hydrolase (adenosine-forming)
VVDPDVGAERRAVALRLADDRIMVGPDNGLLSLAATRAGGVVEAVDISLSTLRLEPVSATFHGRDVFAPVAAHLASGVPIGQVGEPADPDELVRLELPRPRLLEGELVAHAVYIDRFGNVQLNADHEDLSKLGMQLGHRIAIETGTGASHVAHYARTFADVEPGELMVYEDAYRRLALAVTHGSAAHQLRVTIDEELRIRPE